MVSLSACNFLKPTALQNTAAPILNAQTSSLGTSAVSADAFIDSIGVNTHFGYADTYYYSKWAELRQLLIDSGVRHIRDGGVGQPQWYYDRINSLYADAGIRNIGSVGTGTSLDLLLTEMLTSMPQIEGIESLNEYNASGDANWATTLQTYQRNLYAAVKANALTKNLPVIGPSLVIYWTTDPITLGDLSAFLDYGNLHNYYSGRNPDSAGWGGVYNGLSAGGLAFNLAVESIVAGTKTIWTTETGYDWGTCTGGCTPDDINARYTPRMFLEQYRNGIARTYAYQFSSQGSTASSGDGSSTLGMTDFNANPKPSYYSLKNLIALLKDPGPTYTPYRLNYSISGGDSTVHTMLFQKRNGVFYLAIWVEGEAYNVNTLTYETIATQNVTLKLPGYIHSINVNQFQDTGQISANQATLENSSLNLTVSDKLQILQISP